MRLLAVIGAALVAGGLSFAVIDAVLGEGFALVLIVPAVLFTAVALGLGLR
jgi:hypothetical protein